MFSGSRFDVSSSCVRVVVKTVSCFVFLDPKLERAVCLSNVEVVTVVTRDFVDTVSSFWGWCRSFGRGK